ncbi:MAG: EFR1 family ferrodoxin [Endomicrobium sp.]|jgi:ferredoxin|nr:EFR1 family ferrodoxin [Endomicrobium sp.]
MQSRQTNIYFFSGTGNTYLAAQKIKRVFEENENEVNLIRIEKSQPQSVDLSNTVGIAFTVACWNAYPFVREFIQNMPQAFGTEAFVFCTMGNNSLKAAANVGSILKDKGYKVTATKGFIMPNNFLGIQGEQRNKKTTEFTYAKIERFARDILNETSKPENTNFILKFFFAISAFVTNLWKTALFQKILNLKITKDLCVKCGFCAQICPTQNIEMRGYPFFKGKCQICLRCSSYCPQKAISSLAVIGGKTYKALDLETAKNVFI